MTSATTTTKNSIASTLFGPRRHDAGGRRLHPDYDVGYADGVQDGRRLPTAPANGWRIGILRRACKSFFWRGYIGGAVCTIAAAGVAGYVSGLL